MLPRIQPDKFMRRKLSKKESESTILLISLAGRISVFERVESGLEAVVSAVLSLTPR